MTRTDTPPAWDERTQLTTFLDYARHTARAKCMTLCGLINHLRWVEYYWFQVVFLGEEDEGPWTDEDPDREMRVAVDFPLKDLIAEYDEQAARYRELVAAHDLDTKAQRPVRREYVHDVAGQAGI